MSCKSSRKPDRRGLTLIEVVVGIALLAMLLVALLAVHRAHAAQIQAARLRQTAIRVADELLVKWTSEQSIPQAGRSEMISELPGWRWRIVTCELSPEVEQIGVQKVRLEVVREVRLGSSETVLATVELLAVASSPSLQAASEK